MISDLFDWVHVKGPLRTSEVVSRKINLKVETRLSYELGPRMPVCIIDDFFEDPESILEEAKVASYHRIEQGDGGPSPFFQSNQTPCAEVVETFRSLVGRDNFSVCAKYQATPTDTMARNDVHVDGQLHACLVYLTDTPRGEPDGTGFYRHRETGMMCMSRADIGSARLKTGVSEFSIREMLEADRRNLDAWDEVFRIEAKPNRMVIYPGMIFHAPIGFWGQSPQESRTIFAHVFVPEMH